MMQSDLKHKKIFLTGGTGFFGKSILDMIRRGAFPDTEFVILSRDPLRFQKDNSRLSFFPNVRFIPGDITNFSFLDESFDYFLHAATPAITTLEPGKMHDIIINGMAHVIDFAKYSGAKKILFTSSGAVYGIQPPDCDHISEDFDCTPVTEYGIAKSEAENMLKASGIYSCIARCFAFVGPYLNRDIHFAIGNFIGDCLAGRDIDIKGDGTPYRSYLYADDLVEWLFAILAKGENGRPYNVGSDVAISIYDLAVKVRKIIGSHNQIRVLTAKDPSVLPSRYVPCIERIKKELGCSIKFNLDLSIEKSITTEYN